MEKGATGVAVNLGGDMVALGEPSNDSSWFVGVANPFVPGEQVFNSTYGVMQFCNGTKWISMAASGIGTEVDPHIGTQTGGFCCQRFCAISTHLVGMTWLSWSLNAVRNPPISSDRYGSGIASSCCS